MNNGDNSTSGEGYVPSPIDVLTLPDDSIAALAELAPSPDSVHAAQFAKLSSLSDIGRVDLLVVLRRQAGFDAARQIELLAAISRDDPSNEKWSVQEIAAVLRIAPATAATHVHRAEILTTTLRKTLAALRAGDITARHAELLASAVMPLNPAIARAVEERVLDKASEQTVAQFRASVARAVLALDPAGEQERHADAVEQRRVVLTPDLHGMAQLWAYLPADGAATVLTAIDAIAAETIFGNGGDSRSADQRRADALVTLADSALADPALTRRHGGAAGGAAHRRRLHPARPG